MTTGMNVGADLERSLGEWLDREGPQDVPDRVVDVAIARAATVRRLRPRPAVVTRALDALADLGSGLGLGPATLLRPSPARAWVILMSAVILLLAAAVIGVAALLRAEQASQRDGTIAFDASGDIWLVDPKAGALPRRLTDTPDIVEGNPMWSPDGRLLAYWATAEGTSEVHIVDPDGVRVQTLRSLAGLLLPPEAAIFGWAPDGDEVAVPARGSVMEGDVRRVGVETVVIFDIATGDGRRVETDQPTSGFAWSRDGRLIGLTGETGLFVAQADGSAWTELPNCSSAGSTEPAERSGSAIGPPAFAFDGRRVLFAAEAQAGLDAEPATVRRDADILAVSIGGLDEPMTMVGGATNDVAPRVSPDGMHLAFGRSTAVTAGGAFALQQYAGSADVGSGIYVIELTEVEGELENPVRMADGVWPDVAWSPDSRHLLTKSAGWDQLVLIDRDGSWRRRAHPGDGRR